MVVVLVMMVVLVLLRVVMLVAQFSAEEFGTAKVFLIIIVHIEIYIYDF